MQRKNKAGLNTVKKGLTVFEGNKQNVHGSDKQNTIEAGFRGTNHSPMKIELRMANDHVSVSHMTARFPTRDSQG